MGQTGVGKSTLLNKMVPRFTVGNRKKFQKVWVVVATQLEWLVFHNLNGGKIADTPGFSSLDYEVDNAEDLNRAFPEIAQVVMAANSGPARIRMNRIVR